MAEPDAVDGLAHHLSGQIGQTQDEVSLGHAHSGHHLKTIDALSVVVTVWEPPHVTSIKLRNLYPLLSAKIYLLFILRGWARPFFPLL